MLRVLMTLDAMGGVWSQALDTAAMLAGRGMACRLLGFGPRPARTVGLPAGVELEWTDAPLDWMVAAEAELAGVAPLIASHARDWRADIVHVSAPTQAANLPDDLVAVVQSHSCVPTWWEAVRGETLPPEWRWQVARNRAGLRRADSVIVPSASHGRALNRVYGAQPRLRVVPNAAAPGMDCSPEQQKPEKQNYVFAAARWWDEGKNGAVLDAAAEGVVWPVLMAGPTGGPNHSRMALTHAIALGELPRAEVRAHMARAAIFAAPSRYEPFGLAVLEAAHAGACLLLADIPTFRELWHGAAMFADPGDATAWCAAITVLANDPARRQALGDAARQLAAGFSFQSQSAALLATYDAALKARPMACTA